MRRDDSRRRRAKGLRLEFLHFDNKTVTCSKISDVGCRWDRRFRLPMPAGGWRSAGQRPAYPSPRCPSHSVSHGLTREDKVSPACIWKLEFPFQINAALWSSECLKDGTDRFLAFEKEGDEYDILWRSRDLGSSDSRRSAERLRSDSAGTGKRSHLDRDATAHQSAGAAHDGNLGKLARE